MQKLFRIREKNLSAFLEYVPIIKKNLGVESPMIYDMIMATGPQIEPMMTKLIEVLVPQKINSSFDECYKILNAKKMLQIQKVATKEDNIILHPFSNSNPTWWQAYNSHTKHRLPSGMEKATLENLLNIHASLFILHYLHNLKPSNTYTGNMKRESLLDQVNWFDMDEVKKSGRKISCFQFKNRESDSPIKFRDFKEVMCESAGINSDIFDHVTVVNPQLFGCIVQESKY